MAESVASIQQYKRSISIPRQPFMDLVAYEDFSKKELRVLLLLLSSLNGYRPSKTKERGDSDDPRNFNEIDKAEIAKNLGMSTKSVNKAIDRFMDLGILEKGRNQHSKKGYRFTF